MTDHHDGPPDQLPAEGDPGRAAPSRPDDNVLELDERLAAWLAGDVDDLTARSIEREIEADPAVADRVDAIAGVVTRLRRVDAVEPPPHLADGVRDRITDAGRERAPSAQQAASELRVSRPRRRWSWAPVSAAAVVALLAVLAVGSILPRGSGNDGSSEVAGDAALDSEAMTAQSQEGGEQVGEDDAAAQLRAEASQVSAADLDTAGGRERLLDEVAAELDAPAASGDARDQEAAAGAEPQAAPPAPDASLPVECRAELLPEGSGRLLRIVEDVVDERVVVGAVTQALDGTLRVVVADPDAGCDVIAEQTRAPAP